MNIRKAAGPGAAYRKARKSPAAEGIEAAKADDAARELLGFGAKTKRVKRVKVTKCPDATAQGAYPTKEAAKVATGNEPAKKRSKRPAKKAVAKKTAPVVTPAKLSKTETVYRGIVEGTTIPELTEKTGWDRATVLDYVSWFKKDQGKKYPALTITRDGDKLSGKPA